MTAWTSLLPNVAAFSTLLLGGLSLFFPFTLASFVGLKPSESEGLSEIRSIFGCFFIGLGAACLWLQEAAAFTTLGTACIAAALGRIVSVY
ncbi:MAG: DUF4345 domain-containing protein, partial [Leptolyngbya sp. SIO4C1]|nr:DUF4345 domain-containing protein [Leptolyngbya sp. SIO4C1]